MYICFNRLFSYFLVVFTCVLILSITPCNALEIEPLNNIHYSSNDFCSLHVMDMNIPDNVTSKCDDKVSVVLNYTKPVIPPKRFQNVFYYVTLAFTLLALASIVLAFKTDLEIASLQEEHAQENLINAAQTKYNHRMISFWVGIGGTLTSLALTLCSIYYDWTYNDQKENDDNYV